MQEALDLLAEHGDDAKLLAGGHSLIPVLKLRLNDVKYLIDISKIEELRGIKEEGGNLVIGGCVTHGEIAHSDLVADKLPLLAEGADLIGDVQVRNAGTIGGSLAHADPAADWPAIMLACEATFHLQSKSGSRDVHASDFFMGLYHTSLEEGEIIASISVPIPDSDTKGTYVKFMQPASRFAIVGVAALVKRSNGKCEEARVAFNGASSTPFRDADLEGALNGQEFNESNISSAAEKAAEGVSIMHDHFASEKYRQQMAKVYAKRALMSLAG